MSKEKLKSKSRESDTERKIIAAALDEFAEFGKAGARVDRIATKAGVNKAMIYYHFSSKENLYDEVVTGFFTGAAGLIRGQLKEPQTLEDTVRGLAEAYAQLLHRLAPYRSIIIRELASPSLGMIDRIAAILTSSGLPSTIYMRLQEGMASGDVRAVDIRQTILSLLALNVGYALMYPIANKTLGIEDPASFVDERRSSVVDLFLYGVKTR